MPPTPQANAFARGLLAAFSVPALVLFATSLGFGALARDGGFTLGHTAFLAVTMFATPNQVFWSISWRATRRCWQRRSPLPWPRSGCCR